MKMIGNTGKVVSVVFTFVIMCLYCSTAAADPAWTWVGGSKMIGQHSVYGTLGIPDGDNIPGARDGSISWTDNAGDLWSFGGYGYAGEGESGNLNDLWRYSTENGEWTWMSGADTIDQQGVYGVPGFPAAGNIPGARDGSISWADGSGNLWAFGGWGYDSEGYGGMLNDMWRYTIASGEWTWMSGADTVYAGGTYGEQGTAGEGNIPGARYWGVSWSDNTGTMWLFGGYGLDSELNEGDLNDLWRYSPSTGEWTWMSGSDTVEQSGSYGTRGVASDLNVPGGRETAVSWTDNDGNLWLFGGYGLDKNGDYGFLNDLWRYSPATGQWTWMSGADTIDSPGIYGTRGVPDSANVPCSRLHSLGWTDNSGNLWLSGGWGRVCGDPSGWGSLNDLWRYSPATGEWTWMAGDNMTNRTAVFGTLGVPDANNVPGSRQSSIAWSDSFGDFWLFGGNGFATDNNTSGTLNDLWRYSAGSQCCTEGSCPDGYACIDGACQLDQPPRVVWGPVRVSPCPKCAVIISDDPGTFTPVLSTEFSFGWAYRDDYLVCQDQPELNSATGFYRQIGEQEWSEAPLWWWDWVEALIVNMRGVEPGQYEFQACMTDCADNTYCHWPVYIEVVDEL